MSDLNIQIYGFHVKSNKELYHIKNDTMIYLDVKYEII